MTPELSRPLRVEAIPAAGQSVEVNATQEECAAVALRLGISAVHSLNAHFELHPEANGEVRASGRLSARLARTCVVSLDDFDTTQREVFRLRFVPAGTEATDPDPESEDDIPYDGGLIDLGEALVEQLALDLDPYPRMPDATLPDEAQSGDVSPFAALAALAALRRDG